MKKEKKHNAGSLVPKLRFPEFRDAGEWVEKSIGEIGEVITGTTPNTLKREYYGGEKLFVSPADIDDSRFILKTKTTLTELGFQQTRAIPKNSTLFVCIGSTIGKVAQNLVECASNQQINAVVPYDDFDWVFNYYILDLYSNKISKLAGRHAVPIINKSKF
ncbi:MAG: restriction endonuclease subunit S, partial [Leptospira sp.]|nr:restriction endonuclease subunit S [Leptospira sp.]